MKKFSCLLFVIILTVFSFGDKAVFAAGFENETVGLSSSNTSASTSRITVLSNEIVSYNVVNTGSQKVSFRIFKNGYAQTLYLLIPPGGSWKNSISAPQGSEYSLRIYCESSSGTGCEATGVISNY